MLCDACTNQKTEVEVGNCKSCTTPVSSKSYQLCPGCSKTRHQCRCCRKPLRIEVKVNRLGITGSRTTSWVL